MEKAPQEKIIDLSILLEQSAAELYRLFSEMYPQDSTFWWQLHMEEKSHANLIKTARNSFLKQGTFPFEMLPTSIEALEADIKRMRHLIQQVKENRLSRRSALEAALAVEQTSGEMHYLEFMEKDAQSPVAAAFQTLNDADKAHAARIKNYLHEHFSDDGEA